MKSIHSGVTSGFIIQSTRRLGLVLLASLLVIAWSSPPAGAAPNPNSEGKYRQINLVSDLPDVALLQDTNLVNAWGISSSATSPFWVSANGTGLALLYAVTNDSSGMPHVAKQNMEVTIPGDGTPTGQVFNSHTNAFNGDLFLFVSEDGTISGWRPALMTTAEVLTNRSTAVYKGVTLVTVGGEPLLLVANFREATVDAYNGSMNLVAQFADPDAPDGYAPFNVQDIEGMVFVTYAKQDDAKHDDVAGRGHGLIDLLNPATGKFFRFATGSDAGGHLHQIDSPWGVALAPGGFGRHADELLVGNFGSGTIMSYTAEGKVTGLLRNEQGGTLVIPGLWGLKFGNGGRGGVPGILYFSAGPDGESHGVFGSLEPVIPGWRGRR